MNNPQRNELPVRLAIDYALLFQVSKKLSGKGGTDVHTVGAWKSYYINMIDLYNRWCEWNETDDPRSEEFNLDWAKEGLTLFQRFETKLKMYAYGDVSVKQINEEFTSENK